jgi:RHS repeat-associated protein
LVYKVRQLLVAGTWSEKKYGFHLTGAIKRTEDPTSLAVDYSADGYGRIDEIYYRGADSSNPDDRVIRNTLDGEGAVTVSLFYDGSTLKRKTDIIRDDIGRLTATKVYDDDATTLLAHMERTYNGLYFVSAIREKLLEQTLGARGRNFECDPMGRAVAVEDTLSSTDGNRVQVVRNAAGDIIERWHRKAREASWGTMDHSWERADYAFDRRSQLTSAKRLKGLSATADLVAEHNYTYDRLGRLVERQDRQLDSSSTWRNWKKWTWAYDALGRPISETISPNYAGTENPVTLQIAYTDVPLDQGQLHASWGSVLTRTDGRGNQTSYHYDRTGRLVERRIPGYSVGSSAFQWTYEYDAANRLTAWVDGNDARVEIDLDKVTKRPENRKVVSGFGHLSFMTTYEEWQYDQFARVTDARTRYITFNPTTPSTTPTLLNAAASWDTLGRVEREEYEWRGVSNPAPARVVGSWTVPGGTTKDPYFRQNITTASGWELHYNHDNGARLSSMRIKSPAVGGTLTELAAWRHEGGQVLGRKVYPTVGTSNSVEDALTYDGLGQLTGITSTWNGAGTPLLADTITRDWLGNVLSVQYKRNSGGGGDRFKLDGFDRLVEAKLGVPDNEFSGSYSSATYGDRKIEWVLDPAHNRNSVTVTPAGWSPTSTNYSVSSVSNRYLAVGGQNFTYDGNGNLVFDGTYLYKYDYLDRLCEVYRYESGTSAASRSSSTSSSLSLSEARNLLVAAAERYKDVDPAKPAALSTKSVSSTTSTSEQAVLLAYYGYDPYGRRALEYIHEDVISYWTAWDGWRRTDEYKDDGSVFTRFRVFFDAHEVDEHLGYAVTTDNGTSWTRYTLLQGHQGHVRAVMDGNGNVVEKYDYDPYGQRRIYDASGTQLSTGTAVHNDYGYTGRRHDDRIASSLMYFRMRHYHPSLGRFLTSDPIGAWGDASNWGNAYAFVGAMPTSRIDPLGLQMLVAGGGSSYRPPVVAPSGSGGNTHIGSSPQGPVLSIATAGTMTDSNGGRGQQTHHGLSGSGGGATGNLVEAAGDLLDLADEGLEAADQFGTATLNTGAPPAMGVGGIVIAGSKVGRVAVGILRWFVKPLITAARSRRAVSACAAGLQISEKIVRQMAKRGWTRRQVAEAIQNGRQVRAVNRATGNAATRYVHPGTGQSVVLDDVTGDIIHVGGDGFLYGPRSGDALIWPK